MNNKLKKGFKNQFFFSNTLLTFKKKTFVYKIYYWLISFNLFYKIKSFLKYGVVGILGTLTDLCILYFLNNVIGIYYITATLISDFCGNYVNYNLHKKYAFKSKRKSFFIEFVSFIKYYFVSIIAIIVVFGLVIFFVEVFRFLPVVAKLCSDLIVLFIRFIGHKLVFNKK